MRLFFSAFVIALKKSVLPLVSLMLVLTLAGGIVSAAVSSSNAVFEPIEIAVVSGDNSDMAVSLIETTVNSRFKSLAQIKLCKSESEALGSAAVITLPNGFWQSLMTGENLSPKLTIKASSPFEYIWVETLAESAARLLSRAQNAVGGIYAAALADGLSAKETDWLIFSADMTLLNDYLTRKGRFESVEVSATGNIAVLEYYLCSAASFALFSLLFLIYEPIADIKTFSRFSGCKIRCFFAAGISALILCCLLTVFAAVALSGGIAPFFSAEMLSAAVLCAALLLFAVTFLPDMPCSAAFCFGLAAVQAIFGGGFIPEPLLPQELSALCGIMPLSLLRRLFSDAVFSAGFNCGALPLVWCLSLTALSAAKWLRMGENR